MPLINIEENIKVIRQNLDKMTQEMFRMQGVLQTFEGFQKGGLTEIDLPNDPNQPPAVEEELESVQEKPE
jgi:hypothetical protein